MTYYYPQPNTLPGRPLSTQGVFDMAWWSRFKEFCDMAPPHNLPKKKESGDTSKSTHTAYKREPKFIYIAGVEGEPELGFKVGFTCCLKTRKASYRTAGYVDSKKRRWPKDKIVFLFEEECYSPPSVEKWAKFFLSGKHYQRSDHIDKPYDEVLAAVKHSIRKALADAVVAAHKKGDC